MGWFGWVLLNEKRNCDFQRAHLRTSSGIQTLLSRDLCRTCTGLAVGESDSRSPQKTALRGSSQKPNFCLSLLFLSKPFLANRQLSPHPECVHFPISAPTPAVPLSTPPLFLSRLLHLLLPFTPFSTCSLSNSSYHGDLMKSLHCINSPMNSCSQQNKTQALHDLDYVKLFEFIKSHFSPLNHQVLHTMTFVMFLENN